MKRLIIGVVLSVFAGFTFADSTTKPAAAPAPTTRPASMHDIQAAFDAGDYRQVIRDAARALALKGKVADEYDRHDLLLLRAESLLRLNQTIPAATAFEQAAKEAANEKDRNDALAISLLLHRCGGKVPKYTPQKVLKGQKHDPIDVVDPEQRKLAMAALYFDESSAVAPDIKAAKSSTSLPPIAQALRAVNLHNVRMLELAANGNDNETKQSVADLKARAVELIAHVLERDSHRVEEIGESADQTVRQIVFIPQLNGPPIAQELFRRRGINVPETNELKAMDRECTQLSDVALGLGKALGEQENRGSETATLAQQADDLRVKCERILRTDYTLR